MATPDSTPSRPARFYPAPGRCVFEPSGRDALAIAGQVLLAAVNSGELVVSDRATPRRATRLRTIIDRLYVLQDEIHGSSHNLQAAVADVCAASESEACHG